MYEREWARGRVILTRGSRIGNRSLATGQHCKERRTGRGRWGGTSHVTESRDRKTRGQCGTRARRLSLNDVLFMHILPLQHNL